jgi:hypothetical protein
MNAMVRSLSSMKILRVTITFALVFWISGLGCILGCESLTQGGSSAMPAGAGHAHAGASTVVSTSSCHKAIDHSCCSKRSSASNRSPAAWHELPAREGAGGLPKLLTTSASIIEMADGMKRECPMALNAKALGTRVRTDESATSIAFERIEVPPFNAVDSTVSPVPSFLNNRGHTYLRCCVFLI